MKQITTLLTSLGLVIGLTSTASAALTTPATTLNDEATLAQVTTQATTPPAMQLAARSIIHNGHAFRSGRYGRRWVRGHVGPRRVWSGRNNRTAGRHYNPTRRYQIQRRISRHRRHF